MKTQFKNWVFSPIGAMIAGALALGGASGASAGPVTVNLSPSCTTSCSTDGTDGNSRTYTFFDSQGLASRVTVTAWAADQNSTTGALSNYQTGFVGQFSQGVGVTNRYEGNGSSNNSHMADNEGGRADMLVLRFDGDVVLTGAQLNAFAMTATGFSGSGSDTDATFYFGTTTVPFTTPVNLADATQRLSILNHYTDTLGGSSSNFRSVNTTTRFSGNVVVIAPSLADYNRGTSGNWRDGFKLGSVQVDYLTTQAPEPAALGLLGLGVLALGLRRRKR
jgi:PEP-CTERM motif